MEESFSSGMNSFLAVSSKDAPACNLCLIFETNMNIQHAAKWHKTHYHCSRPVCLFRANEKATIERHMKQHDMSVKTAKRRRQDQFWSHKSVKQKALGDSSFTHSDSHAQETAAEISPQPVSEFSFAELSNPSQDSPALASNHEQNSLFAICSQAPGSQPSSSLANIWSSSSTGVRTVAAEVMRRDLHHNAWNEHQHELTQQEQCLLESSVEASQIMSTTSSGAGCSDAEEQTAMPPSAATSQLSLMPDSPNRRIHPLDPLTLCWNHNALRALSVVWPGSPEGLMLADAFSRRNGSLFTGLRGRIGTGMLDDWQFDPSFRPSAGEFVEIVFRGADGADPTPKVGYGLVVAGKDHVGVLRKEHRQKLITKGQSVIAVRWLLSPDDVERSSGRSGKVVQGRALYALSADWYDVVDVDTIVAAGSNLLEPDMVSTIDNKFPLYSVTQSESSAVLWTPSTLGDHFVELVAAVFSGEIVSESVGDDKTSTRGPSAVDKMVEQASDLIGSIVFQHRLLEFVDQFGSPCLPPVPCSCGKIQWATHGEYHGGAVCSWTDVGLVPLTVRRYICKGCCGTLSASANFFRLAAGTPAWPRTVKLNFKFLTIAGGKKLTDAAFRGIWSHYCEMARPRVSALRVFLIARTASGLMSTLSKHTSTLHNGIERIISSATGQEMDSVRTRVVHAAICTLASRVLSAARSAFAEKSLESIIEVAFQKLVIPRVPHILQCLAAFTGILRVDATFRIARGPFLVVTMKNGVKVRFKCGTTAVTVTGTSGFLLQPPMLLGNESQQTLALALGPILQARKSLYGGRHDLAANAVSPAAIAVDNARAMRAAIHLVVSAFDQTGGHCLVLQDLWHAIARVSRNIPNRYVYADGSVLRQAVYDTYVWFTVNRDPGFRDSNTPTVAVIKAQYKFLSEADQTLTLAKAAANEWLKRGSVSHSMHTQALQSLLQRAGWVIRPDLLDSSVRAAALPVDFQGFQLFSAASHEQRSPLMLLARLAAHVKCLKHRQGSERWQSRLESGELCLPVGVGPASEAAGRAELRLLTTFFNAGYRMQVHAGSAILPQRPAESLSASVAAPKAMAALALAAKQNPGVVHDLMESSVLYTGPSGTGPNETAHRHLNDVFSGLGPITFRLFRRLTTLAWLKGLAKHVEHIHTSSSKSETTPECVLRGHLVSIVACATRAMTGATEHLFDDSVLGSLLNGGAAPAAYTYEDARRDGLPLHRVRDTEVDSALAERIRATARQLFEKGQRPVSLKYMAGYLARHVPGQVTTQQVITALADSELSHNICEMTEIDEDESASVTETDKSISDECNT